MASAVGAATSPGPFLPKSSDPMGRIQELMGIAEKAGMGTEGKQKLFQQLLDQAMSPQMVVNGGSFSPQALNQPGGVQLPANPVSARLPDWAIDKNISSMRETISLMGHLLVRTQRLIQLATEGTAVKGKFAIGKVAFVEAYEARDDNGQPSIAVFTMVGDTPMILHDDPNLFPSDGFITKVMMLRDATEKE